MREFDLILLINNNNIIYLFIDLFYILIFLIQYIIF